MFNAPRANAAQSVGGGMSNSFVENPLAASMYDSGPDPWSTSATPEAVPTPSFSATPNSPSSFSNVIADATLPQIYIQAFNSVDPSGVGETSVPSLTRILSTSSLPASTIDRIVNLVSSRPRVSKFEFYVALALTALAQSGKELSVEHVAQLATQNALPRPTLRLDPSTPSHAPAYSSEDPWSTGSRLPATTNGHAAPPSTVSGTGLPKDWWRRLESCEVTIAGQQGFYLTRYTVYNVTTDRSSSIQRRYSEFAFLWECLVRRYPFRLLPALPPKRIGYDENFLEQRRRGLARFLSFVINHPILKNDGILAAFLTEPSFEAWRKHTPTPSLAEEHLVLGPADEMAIPSDLDDKLARVRSALGNQIDTWSRVCAIAERMARRREAMAADCSRLATAVGALSESTSPCWRDGPCDLHDGVKKGLNVTSSHCQVHAENLEGRTRQLLSTTIEALKSQRDLYLATRDLFLRYDRLSGDKVDQLRKKIDITTRKIQTFTAGPNAANQNPPPEWAESIERDQAGIAHALSRRVFMRHALWHEVRTVLHNRENALCSLTVQAFARDERAFIERHVVGNWNAFVDDVENMPYE